MGVIGQVLEQGWNQVLRSLEIEAASRPTLFAVLVVLVLGFIGGRIVAELVRTLLKMTALDEFAVKSDLQSLLRQLSYSGSLSDLIADLVKWAIYLLALSSVLYVFGFRFAADYSATLIGWGTTLLLAAAVMVLGVAASDRLEQITVRFFRVSRLTGLVDESGAEIPVYVIVGKAVKYIGFFVSFLLALNVAGIDILILNILLGMIALGIVVGVIVGTRDLVRNMAVSIYFQLSRVFAADDTITVGEYTGKMAGMRPLYTKLEGDDTTFYVPNWKLVTSVVEREEE